MADKSRSTTYRPYIFSKPIESILGVAASLLAIGGALAADLPAKAKAVEYVRICSLYGTGFFYIPGTDTCIKLGGYLRIDTTFNGGIYDAPYWNGDGGQKNRFRDYFNSRSRMSLTVDTRTASEYGVVRIFGQGDFQFQNFLTSNPASSVGSALGINNALLSTADGGYVAISMLFIQFAGFTFGKSASAYATPWHGYLGNNTTSFLGGHDTVTGVNNIQYSAQFGNGVSSTIGLDDPTVFNRTSVYNLSIGLPATGTGVVTSAYGGTHAPDIVGNIRVDQAWGLFQISGAAHLVNASYQLLGAGSVPTNLSEISGHPDDKWGGSVMAALQIKNLPTGAGDDLKIDGTYAKGDTKQVISTSGGSPNFLMYGSASVPGAYQSVGVGATTDAVYSGGLGGGLTSGLKLTTAYGFRAAFNHNWNAVWSSSLFGSASAVRYQGSVTDPTSGKGAYCASFIAATGGIATKSADFKCNPDYNAYQLGLVTRWEAYSAPLRRLVLSAEVLWFHLDTGYAGTTVVPGPTPKPLARYQFKGQDSLSLNVRIARAF